MLKHSNVCVYFFVVFQKLLSETEKLMEHPPVQHRKGKKILIKEVEEEHNSEDNEEKEAEGRTLLNASRINNCILDSRADMKL